MNQLGKVFLSHKSEDKDFVRYVAEKIGIDRCHYDEYTFEDGMNTLDEIMSALDSTDLFVLFISDKALDSKWVKRERVRAKKLLDQGKIKQIYPIIIDSNPAITYADERIPSWMREQYVIRRITSPKIAVQKIKARLVELTWEIAPNLKNQQTYFFGRNSEIEAFEQRRANLDKPEMVCCVASGFEGIGRKRFMDHCLKKSHILRESSSYNLIQMELHESIEDFILKLSDLSSGQDNPSTVMALKTPEEKIERVVSLLKSLQDSREIVFVEDAGSLITPAQEMIPWLKSALGSVKSRFVLGIASKYPLKRTKCAPNVFSIRLSELNKNDRINMFREYSEQSGLNLERDTLQTVSGLLTGYPTQIFWAVTVLNEYGSEEITSHLHEIVDYSSDKAATILRHFETNEKAINFLAYLSRFEILSADMLNSAFEIDPKLQQIYEEFRALSICNLYGSNGEIIRVSDIIRDYVNRLKHELSPEYKKIIDEMVSASLDQKFFEDSDLATYYGTIKQKIVNGAKTNSTAILPSLYIKSIVEFYNNKRYKKCCALCKQIIDDKADLDFDVSLRRVLYTYFCQSLARQHKDEFFEYVNNSVLSKVDQLYLLGFYYRINGNPQKAIEKLTDALNKDGSRAQIKRELVNAYILIEDYDSALQYSCINYQDDPLNPYHAQSYFKCLINQPNPAAYKDKLSSILSVMENIPSQKAQDMYVQMKALYMVVFDNELECAYGRLDHAIHEADSSAVYLLMTKFDIAFKARDVVTAEKTYKCLEKEIKTYDYFKNALIIRRARLMKLQNKPSREINLELANLKNISPLIKDKISQGLC